MDFNFKGLSSNFINDSEKGEYSTIRITSRDFLDVKSDKVDFHIVIISEGETYNEAVDNLAVKISNIKDMLLKYTDESKIKVHSMSVSPVIETVLKKEGSDCFFNFGNSPITERVVKERAGFKGSTSLYVTFDVSDKNLYKCYAKVFLSGFAENIVYTFYLEDISIHRDILLGKLVEDAKRRANIIAEGLGYSIEGVISVDKRNINTVTDPCYLNENGISFDSCDFEDDYLNVPDIIESTSQMMFSEENIRVYKLEDTIDIEFLLKKVK